MINYNELSNFYIAKQRIVLYNDGGTGFLLGELSKSLFYKLDDDSYADVNRKGSVAQVLRRGEPILSSCVILEASITPVTSAKEIRANSGFVKRLTFKPENYEVVKSK